MHYETQLTRMIREGDRNPTIDGKNKKPYRTAAQKATARKSARLVDGRWVASTPVSYH